MYKTFKSRFAGTCGRCGKDFEAGTVIIWNPRTKYTAHRWCETPDRLLRRDEIRADMAREAAAFHAMMHPKGES